MTVSKDAFRRFQEELAALENQGQPQSPKAAAATRMERARAEFLALRERYGLAVADVVAFFPEEDGIDYLQQLIAASAAKPARGSKKR